MLYDQSGKFIGGQPKGLYGTSGNYQSSYQPPQQESTLGHIGSDIRNAPVLGGVLNFARDITKPVVRDIAAIPQAVQGVSNKLQGKPVESQTYNVPFYDKVTPPQNVREAVGLGAQTVSLGLGPIAGGAAYLGGGSLAAGENLGQIALKTAGGAIGGKVLSKAVPFAAKGIGKAIGGVNDILKPGGIQQLEESSWKVPTLTNKASFKTAAKIYQKATNMGHDIANVLVKSGVRLSDNVENGAYATADTAKNLRNDAIQLSKDLLRPSLQAADYSTPRTPVASFLSQLSSAIKRGYGETAADIEQQVNIAKQQLGALQRKYPQGMSLTDLHDEKITYARNGGYKPTGSVADNNIATTNRAISKVLGNQLENKTPKGLPIKEFNKELSKMFNASDYLDSLQGKRLPQTIASKLRQTAGKIAGLGVANTFGGGILGDVIGYHLGGTLENMLETLPADIRALALRNLEKSNPQAFQAVSKYMEDIGIQRAETKLLQSPPALGTSQNPIITPASTTYEPGSSVEDQLKALPSRIFRSNP